MAGWADLPDLVLSEVQQRKEEGCHVEGFAEAVKAAGNDEARLMEIYGQLMALEPDERYPYVEPSDWNGIVAERPQPPAGLAEAAGKEPTLDQFYGAWLGRCIGCALGKPLEFGHFSVGAFGNPGWKNIKLWFEGADAWPIRGYVPAQSRAEKEIGLDFGRYAILSTREHIRFMESDDDIRYTVLGLILLEEKGLDWDSWDIGKLWHQRLTYGQVCTAETQAYLNFAQKTYGFGCSKPSDWVGSPEHEWVRTYLNPYREWIGAQIRVDGYTYGVAGRPGLAAELAWRDASFSHVKNGIYGAMFVAAMLAQAFVEKDPEKLVEIGLSHIPARSRLAEDIKKAVGIARKHTDQVELVAEIFDAFNHYSPVHTNNNAALVAAALIHGAGDFEKAVTTAVLGGWDTDCNGATVGSIMGAMLGAEAIPDYWKEPLHDTLHAEIVGFHPIAISECAERSFAVYNKLRER